jgi:hypothetical protein
MRTVHRAAWAAWAEWICNSAAAQAVDDMGPADLNDRRGLFFCAERDCRLNALLAIKRIPVDPKNGVSQEQL